MIARLFAHLRRQWMGALSLFLVVTGGTAYAANTVFSSDIVNNEVKSVDIGNGEVKNPDLADNAVGSAKVADNSLKGVDIDEPTLGLFSSGRTALSPPDNTTLNTPVLINTGTFTITGTCFDGGAITSSLRINGGGASYAVFSSPDGVNLEATSGQNNLGSLVTSAGGSGQVVIPFAATSASGDVLHGAAHLANGVQGNDCVYSVTGVGK